MPGYEMWGAEERREVEEVLETGILMRYGFDGPRQGRWKARELEAALCQRTGAAHAQVVSSGTAALTTALAARRGGRGRRGDHAHLHLRGQLRGGALGGGDAGAGRRRRHAHPVAGRGARRGDAAHPGGHAGAHVRLHGRPGRARGPLPREGARAARGRLPGHRRDLEGQGARHRGQGRLLLLRLREDHHLRGRRCDRHLRRRGGAALRPVRRPRARPHGRGPRRRPAPGARVQLPHLRAARRGGARADPQARPVPGDPADEQAGPARGARHRARRHLPAHPRPRRRQRVVPLLLPPRRGAGPGGRQGHAGRRDPGHVLVRQQLALPAALGPPQDRVVLLPAAGRASARGSPRWPAARSRPPTPSCRGPSRRPSRSAGARSSWPSGRRSSPRRSARRGRALRRYAAPPPRSARASARTAAVVSSVMQRWCPSGHRSPP